MKYTPRGLVSKVGAFGSEQERDMLSVSVARVRGQTSAFIVLVSRIGRRVFMEFLTKQVHYTAHIPIQRYANIVRCRGRTPVQGTIWLADCLRLKAVGK